MHLEKRLWLLGFQMHLGTLHQSLHLQLSQGRGEQRGLRGNRSLERHPVPHREPSQHCHKRRSGAVLHHLEKWTRLASNSFNAADYYTRTQVRQQVLSNHGNAEVFTLVRDSLSIPRQMRGILPRAPLAWSYLFSGTITELRCDAYSKAEADGRYLISTGYTGTLDGRYLVTNANAGSCEAFTLICDASSAGSSGVSSLGPRVEPQSDAWSKSAQTLNLFVVDIDSRPSTLEASGGVPDPIVVGAVHGSGTALTLRAGSTNVRIEAQNTTTVANFGSVENFLGGAPRLRVDEKLYIDDVSGTAAGLKTNASWRGPEITC